MMYRQCCLALAGTATGLAPTFGPIVAAGPPQHPDFRHRLGSSAEPGIGSRQSDEVLTSALTESRADLLGAVWLRTRFTGTIHADQLRGDGEEWMWLPPLGY